MHKMSPPCDMCISKLTVGISSDSLVNETLKRKTRDGELNSTMFETQFCYGTTCTDEKGRKGYICPKVGLFGSVSY